MQTRPNPEIRHCRTLSVDTAPKLAESCDSTVSTLPGYKNTFSSYDRCRICRWQVGPTRPPAPNSDRTTRIIRTTLATKNCVSATTVFGRYSRRGTPLETPATHHPPTPTGHFTYFTETTMKKTRNSYDPSEVPTYPSCVRPEGRAVPTYPSSVRPERREVPFYPSSVHPEHREVPSYLSSFRPDQREVPSYPSSVRPERREVFVHPARRLDVQQLSRSRRTPDTPQWPKMSGNGRK